ncbi:methyl-accepting chemotaxis protein [Novosphingobium colocasiae]|uniref:methyl-accepting chemotaxis protein n=1 Tax=Novosphingobium colocasiae TaxID=1256513 RepID=UPI0035B42F02
MIKDQIRRASGRLVALIVVAVLLTALAVAQVRFGGPIQRKHALQDEMLADILPPPAYVVEPYLLATLAAEDPRQAAPALADMARLKAEFEQRKAYWAGAAVPETVRPQLGRVIATADVFWNAVDSRFAPAVRAGDAEQVRRIHRTVLAPIYDRQHQDVVALVALSRQVSEAAMVRDRWMVGILLALSALAGLGVVASILWAARVLQQRMIAPLSQNVRLIGSLAGGSYDIAIDGLSRTDEFGSMARAMEVFRKSGIAKREADAAQQVVVRALTTGLRKLAEKDLEYRIEDEDFPEAYEQLRENFNSALEALARVMGTVRVGAGSVMRAIAEIRAASDDLAVRNQQQAASLEETAAAMNHVNGRVRQYAGTAADAQEAISGAHRRASEGGEVVREAIGAMAMIEQSSQQISSIINVIDGIAFQTNLLALNAGVEAARAGDAGKGFAVVANEVRALAQRSADAAQDIKALIDKSSTQVGHGVELVGQTGTKLEEIVAQVGELHALIGTMTDSARDQASSLDQVNTAVNEMDRMTQQNAAMVEETTAATRSLESEAQSLTRMMSTFRTRINENRPQGAVVDQAMRRSSSVGVPIGPPPGGSPYSAAA